MRFTFDPAPSTMSSHAYPRVHAPTTSTTTTIATPAPHAIEAKLVILGAQGVGKTSLVQRFLNPDFSTSLPQPPSTVGASFHTRILTDPDTNTNVRLQIWDTAGQERFRSISRLYYRGANAGVLCYDVTSEQSWQEMKTWLRELREYADEGCVVHVVGCKSDLELKREVSFERTVLWVGEMLGVNTSNMNGGSTTPGSKRSSGMWNQDLGWDSCHEVNAKDGDGIEEVFRVIARKLVEQRLQKEDGCRREDTSPRSNTAQSGEDYFGGPHGSQGSFRLGHGDKRRSWLGLPSVGLGIAEIGGTADDSRYETNPEAARTKGKCC
jgi:small GTP-binding protein